MKVLLVCLSLVWSIGTSFALQEPSVEQMKSDLMGKTMGGREKGWKFQSVEQIKELTIKDKKEEAGRRVYSITLKLEDPRVSQAFAAEAELTYKQVDSGWQVEGVGLTSMKKLEP
jgi:hypothetical protein